MDLFWIGMALLVTTLAVGHTGSSSPIGNLGDRPMGVGLWTWLQEYVKKNGTVGCWGYDPIQGAWSPPFRLLLHISLWILLWSVLDSLLLGFVPSAILSLALYGGATWYMAHQLLGVSYPGSPRIHKMQRIPQWENKLSLVFQGKEKPKSPWRCAVAEDAHNVTERRFGDHPEERLTGEPAGRQIWTTLEKEIQTDDDDIEEDLVSVTASIRGMFGLGGGGTSPQKGSPSKRGIGSERSIPETVSPQKGSGTSTTTSRKSPAKKPPKFNSSLILRMATGGRQPGFNPAENPNSCDMVFRAQQIRAYLDKGKEAPSMETIPKTAKEAAKKGAHFYSMLQTEDGHWAGDYGGPHFLMPGLIVAWYVMGCPSEMLDDEQITLMKHYIAVHQQIDGGWGTHLESPSTMFGTTLMYVALRLLGVDKDDEVCKKGRTFLQEHGGAVMTSSWAKMSLCLLGCMEWDGHNSVPPEMWLLPNWFPFHPGRLWCHCRMVYLPMGYLYGSRFVYDKAGTDPVIQSLRKELYCQPYEEIPWMQTRHDVAPMDNYSPIPIVMRVLQDVLARYETWSFLQPFKNWVRDMGLKFCVEYMAAEDLQTNYIDIGPVNKVFNMISAFHAAGSDLRHPTVVKHMMRVSDYLWVAEDGMKMQGYNGSQCWDTSFAIQAFGEAGLLEEFSDVAKKVWEYLERTQILSTETSQESPAFMYESNEYRSKFYRHISKGGWPFSTSAHGWPISDCTGEGLKAVLCLSKTGFIKAALDDDELDPISEKRLQDAVNILLTYQNEDKGWATYENNRGFGWYESLNPSEVFGDIMIDYSYVECSMASLTALVDFQKMYPDHRKEEIDHAVEKGKDFIKSMQRSDGSWYGSWACCFTYACWFGVEGLIACGEDPSSPEIQRACGFLLSQQRENGGWGEDFTSCYDKDYAADGMKAYGIGGSGVVNTAWALLALSCAKCSDVEAIRRGVQFLMDQQLPSGDWPQQGVSGVFNRACGITYTAYRNVFPVWALGRCVAVYGDELDATSTKIE